MEKGLVLPSFCGAKSNAKFPPIEILFFPFLGSHLESERRHPIITQRRDNEQTTGIKIPYPRRARVVLFF